MQFHQTNLNYFFRRCWWEPSKNDHIADWYALTPWDNYGMDEPSTKVIWPYLTRWVLQKGLHLQQLHREVQRRAISRLEEPNLGPDNCDKFRTCS